MQLVHAHLHTSEFAENTLEGVYFNTDTLRYFQFF